jgi:hypothetical protein
MGLVNGPRDWPPTQGGSWLCVRREFGDIYQWFDHRAWRVSGRLCEYWYYWRCRFWSKYNTVTITTLPPTWNEWDIKLLHVAFAVLVDYIESGKRHRQLWTVKALLEELANPETDTMSKQWCESHLPIASEQDALYRWWTIEREQRRKEEEAALLAWHDAFEAAGGMTSESTDNPRLNRLRFAESPEIDALHDRHIEIEQRNDAEDEEMLIRLMKIRDSLWS